MATEQSEVVLNDMPQNDDIPEENEDLMISDENGHTFAPPSRIAARFLRPSAQRRISSAASSRRNSLSSSHSVQLSSSHSIKSNSSYAQARRNNHVAQYLRRASIIQGRKDRLAAREAHAEQVRLRAALAKATPRASNSEERAAAAEQARKERLAQVAATCAEEVRRAKKVAEETKERRAAEEERVRVEMHERLADAAKRRMELRRTIRRPRTASSPSAVAKKADVKLTTPIDPEAAARCIQRAWRIQRRKLVLDRFIKLGLGVDKTPETDFETTRDLLNEDKVLETTSALLNLLGVQTQNDRSANDQMATRTFLSAYMILGHPDEVLRQDGDLEQVLIEKAKDLLISFEAVLARCTSYNAYTPPNTLLEVLVLAYSTFFTAFSDWKTRDSSLLVEMMVASFVNLESIWQNVKDDTDGAVAEDYRDGIRKNQLHLLARIQKLVGRERGKNMVAIALRESRRRRRRKPTGNLRPRVADATVHASPATGLENVAAAAEAASQISEQPLTRPGSEVSAINKVFSVFPSSNRVLAHELALDKDYRADLSPHSQVHDALNRKICEAMRRAFERGDGGAWTIAMADNIRHKLLYLIKQPNNNHPLQPIIMETLDHDFIAGQVEQGVFSYSRFFNFMATLLPKLCAPVRDDQVKALAEELRRDGSIEEMIEKLFKLLHVIDILCLDFANYMLSRVAPVLIREAAGYEHRMFAQDLEMGVHNLDKLRRWWNNAAVSLFTETDRQDPRARPSIQKIYARGLVDLAVATGPLRATDVPETLHLDIDRLREARQKSVRIAIIGAILMTAKNLLKRDMRQQWKAEASRMWDTFRTADSSVEDNAAVAQRLFSIVESSRPMPPASKTHLQGMISRLLSQAENGKLTDAVVKVLFQRLKTHVHKRLAADGSEERVRVATMAGEGLASAGLPEFVQQVGDVVDVLGRISDVDRRAHAVWYEEVARASEQAGEEESTHPVDSSDD